MAFLGSLPAASDPRARPARAPRIPYSSMTRIGADTQATCTGTLHTALLELERVNGRLDHLRQSSQSLARISIADHQRCSSDFAAQVDALEAYREGIAPIDSLGCAMREEEDRVEDYRSKLDQIQAKIDSRREVEEKWRRRTSRRIRLLLGLVSVLIIVWLLATANDDPAELGGQDRPVKLQLRDEAPEDVFSLLP